MNILFFMSCIILYFGLTLCLNLECTFKNEYFLGLGNLYYCEFTRNLDIISPETAYIGSSSGVHWGSKDNDDVLGVDGKDKNIKYFPKGLNLIFRNLKAIDIESGKIMDLYQSDLRPYEKLEYLDLGNNDIEVLEDGVFDYNSKLKVISLSGNKLYHIDPNVFNGLRSLEYLVLEGNRCINESARFDITAVSNIIQNTKSICQNSELLKGRLLQQRKYSYN